MSNTIAPGGYELSPYSFTPTDWKPEAGDEMSPSKDEGGLLSYGFLIAVPAIIAIVVAVARIVIKLQGANRSAYPRYQTLAVDEFVVVAAVKGFVLFSIWKIDNQLPDPRFCTLAMDKFLDDMEKEKPIRFTSDQLRLATDNYTHLLGSGGFGTVYKGSFSNGVPVAVKVLKGSSDERIEAQFTAEVSTIGRTHHLNLVRLYGFCYERDLRALVYEYMANGSLDHLLFGGQRYVEWEKLYEIAVGTGRGITYLHEECAQRIVHYDIKPANVLLDSRFIPKVADFGLAKLTNRDITHLTMTGGRGTPGYAAPEMWMPFPVTHKCDIYSFGMLLFEVLGRRRNLEPSLAESQEWFPMWVWKKFERGAIDDVIIACQIPESDKDKAERITKVAFWCVQYLPELRPSMSIAVKMLEGGLEIPQPLSPFGHMVAALPVLDSGNHRSLTDTTWSLDISTLNLSKEATMHVMRQYEIEIASS